MKPQNFIVGTLFVAILGVVAWWLRQSTPTQGLKVAETSKPIVADQPKVLSPAPRVEQPLASPVVPEGKTAEPESVVVPPTPVDFRAKPDTVIVEYLRVFENEDYYTLFLEQIPPDEVPPGKTLEGYAREEVDDWVQRFPPQSPMMKFNHAMDLAALHSIQGQTPVMSDNGNTATYTSHIVMEQVSSKVTITVRKKKGLWYIDGLLFESEEESDPVFDDGVDATVPDSSLSTQ